LLSINPNLTPDEIRNISHATTDNQVEKLFEDFAGLDQYHGYW